MRAKLRACSAMAAYQRPAGIFVKADSAYGTRVFTPSAADTFMSIQQDAPALARYKRIGRANLSAVRLPASLAYICNELSGQTSAGLYMDTTFTDRMVFTVHSRASQHTSKTANAFVYFIRPDNFCQILFPLQCV